MAGERGEGVEGERGEEETEGEEEEEKEQEEKKNPARKRRAHSPAAPVYQNSVLLSLPLPSHPSVPPTS